MSRPSAPALDDAALRAAEIARRVARDQAEMLFRLGPQAILAGGVFSLIVGFVLWGSMGGPTLAAWVVARLLITAVRVWDCRNFVAAPPHDEAGLQRRRIRFRVLMAAECVSWSLMGIGFAQAADPQIALVMLAALVAVASVGVFSLGSDFVASGLFVGIVLLPNAVDQLLRPGAASVVAGGGMLILTVLLWIESRGLEQRILELLRLRHENATIAEERQRARLLAEHSSRTKSRFLATVSHEMRTPLNGILGMTQLMQQSTGDATQRAQLDVVAQSARHLQAVIGDLLDLSRIESGKPVVEPTAVALPALVDEVADLLGPVALQKGLEFLLDRPAELPRWIRADGPRVKQVLHNLVGNAIKFTPEGSVALDVRTEGGAVVFSVSDTGIGIPPDQIERVFHAFEQVAAPGTPEYRAGTGLGLTISRELARAMGGDVVCAPRVGRGMVFRFHFPLQVEAAPQPAAAAPAPAALHGRVLLAEDSPVNALIAKTMLERMGLEVDLAEDGEAALERLRNAAYAMVLMDCQMPVLDGWEATRRWRAHERSAGRRRTPIVALTANAVLGDRERCLAAGMDDHLPKPIEYETLGSTMQRHLAA
jgi:signal transduction histidine kinase/ActR/RegA family two-component response regulator